MTGIQLIGKDAVISNYTTIDGGSWALYQGREFIVGGTDVGDLETWLSNFEKSGTSATYKLRVYDSDEIPTSVTGNRDYIASINFKLVDTYAGEGIAGHTTKLMERLGAIEKRFEEREEQEEPEQESTLNNIIMGWLENPVKLAQIAGAIKTVMSGSSTASPVLPPAAAIGAADPGATAEDQLTKLANALDTLEKKDPKLVTHLEKLAALASSDETLFNSVISKLDLL